MLLEHRLPLTSKRTDAILAGVHPRTGKHSYVVVELKQWSQANLWEDNDALVEVDGARYLSSHPSTQVAGYVQYLRDFARAFEYTPDELQGVAYLHNATDFGVSDLLASRELAQALSSRERAAASSSSTCSRSSPRTPRGQVPRTGSCVPRPHPRSNS